MVIEGERRAVLIGGVKACMTQSMLDEVFRLYEISDVDTKIDILVEAMDSPEVGFCGNPTSEDKYETLCDIFLSRTWQV